MSSFHHSLPFFFSSLFFLQLFIQQNKALGPIDTTKGFKSLPFNASHYHIQKPHDILKDKRYSFVDGVHKLWVFANDKPHTLTSETNPRTEIGIQGYNYSSGVWQFEGQAYVPNGTSGVSIMQIFGATAPRATTLMLRVYNGTLMYYQRNILASRIYDRWFRVNVIHDVDKSKVNVFINGHLKLVANGSGGTFHIFKYGVYAQNQYSSYMESRWKGIKIFRKSG